MIWLITLPSLIALGLKLFAVWLLRRSTSESLNLNLVIVAASLLLMNAIELIGLSNGIVYGVTDTSMLYMLIYYATLNSFLAAIFVFSIEQYRESISSTVRWIVYCVAGTVSALIVFTDVVVQGYAALTYSVTRVPGPLYFIFQSFALTCVAGSLVFLLKSTFEKSGQAQRRAVATMIAFAPLLLTVGGVVVAMLVGLAINMTMLVSVATSFLLLLLVYIESKEGLFGLLARIPGTGEWKRRRAFYQTYEDVILTSLKGTRDPYLWKNTVKQLEQALMEQLVALHDGDAKATAEAAGISVSSVNRKRKKL